MTFDKAARVLGVKLEGVTEEQVKLAFTRAVKLAHPDVGGGHNSAASNIAEAKEARDTLLKICGPGMAFHQCKTCKGAGSVRGTFAMQVCPSCKGSGNENLHRR